MYQGGADVPAAARQPGRRHPDHLRGQHPALPGPAGDVLHALRGRASSRTSRNVIVHVPRPADRRSTSILYFLLTVGFTYFYTAFTFKPDETADQLRKNGGFIPGIRPGRPTQDYLAKVVYRITPRRRAVPGHRRGRPILVGVALPGSSRAFALGGTGLLIVVSRRRRDDEADRGAADDAQLRRASSDDAACGAPMTVIVMLGAPGAGKGTQAPSSREQLGLPARLDRRPVPGGRCATARRSARGRALRGARPARARRPDGRGCSWTASASPTPPTASILDGFPRTRPRPRRSTRRSPSVASGSSAALYIEVPADELVERLSGRRVCTRRPATSTTTAQPAAGRRASATSTARSSSSATTTSPRPSGPGSTRSCRRCTRSSTTTPTPACLAASTAYQAIDEVTADLLALLPAAIGASRPARRTLGRPMVTRKSTAEIERCAAAGRIVAEVLDPRRATSSSPASRPASSTRSPKRHIRKARRHPLVHGLPGVHPRRPFPASLCISHRRRGRPRHPRRAAHPRGPGRVGRRRRDRRRLAWRRAPGRSSSATRRRPSPQLVEATRAGDAWPASPRPCPGAPRGHRRRRRGRRRAHGYGIVRRSWATASAPRCTRSRRSRTTAPAAAAASSSPGSAWPSSRCSRSATTSVHVEADGWTVATADGSLAAHWEHTIAVTDDGPADPDRAMTWRPRETRDLRRPH